MSSVRESELSFEGARGCDLAGRSWLAAEPRRVLLLVHGLAEHSGRYDHVGRWFAERGCAVYAYDQRGHGRSGGRPGHLEAFSDLLDDLDAVLPRVRAMHPGLPLFLVGHSMGGLVVISFLCFRAPAIDGAVTSGAALALPERFPAWRLVAARTLRRLVPRLALPNGLDATMVSRDPEIVRAYVDDPLVHRSMTSSLAMELFEAIPRAAGAGSRVRVPVLMLHGGADRLVDARGTREFFAQVDVAGSDLHVYPDLAHEIFNEPERDRVFADVLAWLEKRGQVGAS